MRWNSVGRSPASAADPRVVAEDESSRGLRETRRERRQADRAPQSLPRRARPAGRDATRRRRPTQLAVLDRSLRPAGFATSRGRSGPARRAAADSAAWRALIRRRSPCATERSTSVAVKQQHDVPVGRSPSWRLAFAPPGRLRDHIASSGPRAVACSNPVWAVSRRRRYARQHAPGVRR